MHHMFTEASFLSRKVQKTMTLLRSGPIPTLGLLTAAALPIGGILFFGLPRAEEVYVTPEADSVVEERRAEGLLLPDLVPLPPKDVRLEGKGEDGLLLRFSTTYYNQGDGPLELRADPNTAGIREDIERDVYQRVYRTDETYDAHVVGNFLWHQEHLHYHYADFVTYTLTNEVTDQEVAKASLSQKATFCLRDISRVSLDLPNRPKEAAYRICGKELQGVSVGWGDTYFDDFPDQELDMTDLPSGTYRLVFTVNPAKRLKELRYGNNVSGALLSIDKEKKEVTILREWPEPVPEIEHVHLEQPFGLGR